VLSIYRQCVFISQADQCHTSAGRLAHMRRLGYADRHTNMGREIHNRWVADYAQCWPRSWRLSAMRRPHGRDGSGQCKTPTLDTCLCVGPTWHTRVPGVLLRERQLVTSILEKDLDENPSQSYGASAGQGCCTGLHNSVTCHPTQVNAVRLNPSQAGHCPGRMKG